jgi:hypothetical protein
MVPGPLSNSSFEAPTCIKTEQELRASDGTQVPEPRMVTFIPDWTVDIFNRPLFYLLFVNFYTQLFVIGYSLLGLSRCISDLSNNQ